MYKCKNTIYKRKEIYNRKQYTNELATFSSRWKFSAFSATEVMTQEIVFDEISC